MPSKAGSTSFIAFAAPRMAPKHRVYINLIRHVAERALAPENRTPEPGFGGLSQSRGAQRSNSAPWDTINDRSITFRNSLTFPQANKSVKRPGDHNP